MREQLCQLKKKKKKRKRERSKRLQSKDIEWGRRTTPNRNLLTNQRDPSTRTRVRTSNSYTTLLVRNLFIRTTP